MTFDLQELAALAIVAAAGAYLARNVWRQFAGRRPGSPCSGCGGCASGAANQQFVPLAVPKRKGD